MTNIGSYAFYSCDSLTSVTIPDSVTSIGSAFSGCRSLASINVDDGNNAYTDVDGVLFDKEKRTIICYPAGKTETSYIIPDGVTSIGSDAFYSCGSLTSVTIPNNVTRIGNFAFYWCTSLTSVTIPDSVTSIGNSAFFYCSKLEIITYRGTEEKWSTVTKGSNWDYKAGKDTANGTYTIIFDYDMSELLTNLGASVRPESDEYSAGLRFGVSFNKADFGIEGTYAYDGADITFGMLLIPERVMTNAGYETVRDYYENYDGQLTLDVPAKKIYAQDEETVTYTAVLLGIPESDYESVICALPYVIVDGEYYFGNEMKTSFYGIAAEARGSTYSDDAIAAIVDEKKKAEAQAMADALDKIIAIVKVEE